MDAQQDICKMLFTPSIDLFATWLNCQVPRFHSWLPDLEAEVIDTFMTKWEELFYAFPPFCLIGRVVQKIIHENAQGILVVPNWPTQSWYSLLQHIVMMPVLNMPVTNETLCLPCSGSRPVPHPLSGRMTLQAYLVNGRNLS